MKTITLFPLLLLCIYLAGNAQRNVHVDFLKPNARNITIKDTGTFNQPTGILSAKSNFEIKPADAGKFKISTGCAVARDTDKTMFCVNGEAYVDTSIIIQFDLLPQQEKKKRIEQGFNEYIKAIHHKPFNPGLINTIHDNVYDLVREEFVKYWFTYKDDDLLKQWFSLLDEDGGSADEMQDMFAAKLFCEATEDFTAFFQSNL